MPRVILGVFFNLFLLSTIGVGPAFWFNRAQGKQLAYALGMAPAVGLALLGLLGFPLVRFIAPVEVWAWPTTLILIVLSLVLVFRERGDIANELRGHASATLFALGFVLLCFIALVSPLLMNDIGYSLYRWNSSDAFYYISLSETVRFAPWNTIMNGTAMTMQNLEGLRQLAGVVPTSLFTARFIGQALPLDNNIARAWGAQVSGLPTYGFYYPFQLVLLATAVPVVLVLGDRLKLSRIVKYLAAAAITFGFWARFILEADASNQISTLPLFLLAVLAWIELERETPRLLSRWRALLALSLAALIAFYVQVLSVLIAAFLFYYALSIFQRTRPISTILAHSVTVLLVLAILGVTAQLDYLVRTSLFQLQDAGQVQINGPFGLDLVAADGVAAVWGIPRTMLMSGLPRMIEFLGRRIGDVLGIFETTALFGAAVYGLRKSANVAVRIVLSTVVGGLLVVLAFLAMRNLYSAGKAFTYAFPFLVFGATLFPQYLPDYRGWPLRRLTLALVSFWLISQSLIGLYLPYAQEHELVKFGRGRPANDLDLSPIVNYLNAHSPRLLLVDVPRTDDWTFAYYVMHVLSHYPVYFQSGLITDNSVKGPNMWFDDLTKVPDYAVILKSVDYIAPGRLGISVVETRDLVLYQITSGDLTQFAKH